MPNKFTQTYLATFNKKANAKRKVDVSGYSPDVQMSDSVPGLMGRGGEGDVLTNKPLSLQPSFVSGTEIHPDGLNRPPTVYYPSKMSEAGAFDQMMPRDFTRYGNYPEGAEIIRPRKTAPATRPGSPQTVISPGIGGNFSYGNTPPAPAPQLRATPPGLRPGPSALGKKAEAFSGPSRFTLEGSRPNQGAAPEISGSRPSSFTLEHTAARPTAGVAFTSGVDLPAPAPALAAAPTPTILEMLMTNKLLAGAGLAAAGAAGYMGYKALSKKKKKKDDDDDDDKTASFTEAYYNGRKGPQSYADTYLTALHKRAAERPVKDGFPTFRALPPPDGPYSGADFGKGGHTRLSADFGANEAPLTRRQREDGERESLHEEDRRNRAAGLPLRPNPNQAPRSWNPINIAADTAMNRADFADRTNAAGPVGNLASMSAEERALVGNKINSMARSAGNQIKSMARSAGSAVNRVSDAYGRANEFMGDKLAPVIYPKVYEEAAGVDRNIPILMQHSRFAKALAPFDSKAPPKPGRQLSNISRLGTPEFSRTKLNPPPDLTGVVNSAAQNMNPNIKFK